MKRHVVFIALLLIVVYPCRSQYDNTSFKLFSNDLRELVLNTGTINEDTILTIGIDTPIYGLSISGVAVVPNEDSFVRIVLKGTDGKEYLVYEANNLLSSASSSTLSNVGIETLYLDGVVPESLLLYVIAGSIALDKLHYVSTVPTQNARSSSVLSSSENRTRQAEAIVEQLNVNLKNQNKLWRAGITDIALMSYEEKKVLFGDTIPNLKGLEYYRGGVFKLSDILPKNDDILIEESPNVLKTSKSVEERITSDSPYINEFDWGNRHGKNWITPASNQVGQTCWAFAPVAHVEAFVNLYFNRLLNYNLSENDIIACYNPNYNPQEGGQTENAYRHMKNNGIVDQESFPNDLSLTCEDKSLTPRDIITIGSYNTDNTYYWGTALPSDDVMKHKIIDCPVLFRASAPKYNGSGHVFILTGFRKVKVGDIIKFDPLAWGGDSVIVEAGNELCERTAFHFKNTWGENWGYDGFGYFVVDDLYRIYFIQIEKLIHSEVYTDADIVCEDADGDGYFWWGIGPKPATIPSWAQDEADGDDSNPQFGPMDEYGYLESISLNYPDIVINTTTTWNEEDYLYNNVRVISGGKLIVTANVMKHPQSSIIVESGGELIINGGTITRGSVVVKSNGKMSITGGGEIRLDNSNNFKVEKGGVLNQSFGKIGTIN